jgi:hypothetical protein
MENTKQKNFFDSITDVFRNTGDFTNINPNPYCQEACIESSEQNEFETFFNDPKKTPTQDSIILFGYTDSVQTEDEKQGCFITNTENGSGMNGKSYYYEHIIGKYPTTNSDFAGRHIVLRNSHTNRGEPTNPQQHVFHPKSGKSPSNETKNNDHQHVYYLDRIIKDTIYICYHYKDATIFKIVFEDDNGTGTFTSSIANNKVITGDYDNSTYGTSLYDIFNDYVSKEYQVSNAFKDSNFISNTSNEEASGVSSTIIKKSRDNTGGIFVCKYKDENNDNENNIVPKSKKTYNKENVLYYWVVGLIDPNSSQIICSMWTSKNVDYKLNMYSNAAKEAAKDAANNSDITDADAIMAIDETKILDNRYTFEVSTNTMDINVSNLFTRNVLTINDRRCILVLDNACENIKLEINFKKMNNITEPDNTAKDQINNPADAATAQDIATEYLSLLTKDSKYQGISSQETSVINLNKYITILKCKFLKSPLLNSYITEYIKHSLSNEQKGTQESTKSRNTQEKYNEQIKQIREDNVQYILDNIEQMQIKKTVTLNTTPIVQNIINRLFRIREYSTGGFDATAVKDSNKFVKLKFGSFDYQKLYNFTKNICKLDSLLNNPIVDDKHDKRFSFKNIGFGDYKNATYTVKPTQNNGKKQTKYIIDDKTYETPSQNIIPKRIPIGIMSITTGSFNKYNTSALSVNREVDADNNKNTTTDGSGKKIKIDNKYIVFITTYGQLSIYGKYLVVQNNDLKKMRTNTYYGIAKLACRYYIHPVTSEIVEEVVNPLLNYDYKDFKYKPLPDIKMDKENPVYEQFDINPSKYWNKHFELSPDDLFEWEKNPNNFEKLTVSNFKTNNQIADPLNSNPSNASNKFIFNTEFTATFNNMYGVNSGGSHKRKTHNRKTHNLKTHKRKTHKRKTHKRKMHKHKRKTHK